MKKKFITLGIAFLMLFSLAACNTDFDLEGYKAEAKAEIESYATESNYCPDNWSLVCDIVEKGKEAVDDAKSKETVDMAIATAKEEIDEVAENMEIAREKLHDSWWDGKVEVLLDFPRVVQQGDSFSIKVTTTNLLDVEIEQWSGSCCQNKGVLISKIKLQSVAEYEMKHWHFDAHNEDEALTTIPIGGFLETIWEIETTHPEQFVAGIAPKGVYDIYLSNDEVLRNAITII